MHEAWTLTYTFLCTHSWKFTTRASFHTATVIASAKAVAAPAVAAAAAPTVAPATTSAVATTTTTLPAATAGSFVEEKRRISIFSCEICRQTEPSYRQIEHICRQITTICRQLRAKFQNPVLDEPVAVDNHLMAVDIHQFVILTSTIPLPIKSDTLLYCPNKLFSSFSWILNYYSIELNLLVIIYIQLWIILGHFQVNKKSLALKGRQGSARREGIRPRQANLGKQKGSSLPPATKSP
ncbi:hypothetical protein Taro_039506 [Colocasia esculenta]|uniref:Uncharacterized protein n=1 Tax=Colocasia esculenta TaxID=4460 RepID=A0A843WVY7_COLES|nr:hypothetical protein [Colocasia esculenta]